MALHRGAVGAQLVAPAHPAAGCHGGGLGGPDQLHGQVAVGGLGGGRHDHDPTWSPAGKTAGDAVASGDTGGRGADRRPAQRSPLGHRPGRRRQELRPEADGGLPAGRGAHRAEQRARHRRRGVHGRGAPCRRGAGGTPRRRGAGRHLAAGGRPRPVAPYELVERMRASVVVLGALLARCGQVRDAPARRRRLRRAPHRLPRQRALRHGRPLRDVPRRGAGPGGGRAGWSAPRWCSSTPATPPPTTC